MNIIAAQGFASLHQDLISSGCITSQSADLLRKQLISTLCNMVAKLNFDFKREWYERIKNIPIILKVVLFATLFLGVFQLLALFFPMVSPKINGLALTSPILIVAMAIFHILISVAIFKRKIWSTYLIIFTPLFQYSILYLQFGVPSLEELKLASLGSLIWAVLFSCYFYIYGAKSYFSPVSNA